MNYQFKTLPDVMTEVRKHGVKAKHMSTGERSMLSAFQESAQTLQEQQITARCAVLALLRHHLEASLEHGIIQVITRAQDAADAGRGLKLEDVSVLKLLYLIRYIDYIKSTINNITILMADDMNVDTMALRPAGHRIAGAPGARELRGAPGRHVQLPHRRRARHCARDIRNVGGHGRGD